MPQPHRILTTTLTTLGLTACATTPTTSPLTGGEWRVVQVGEYGTIANSRAALGFAPDGSLTGNASCNRLTASYAIDGERLTIGAPALTRMACPSPEMRQEAMLVELLEQVNAYRIDSSGALVLHTPTGEKIIALRN